MHDRGQEAIFCLCPQGPEPLRRGRSQPSPICSPLLTLIPPAVLDDNLRTITPITSRRPFFFIRNSSRRLNMDMSGMDMGTMSGMSGMTMDSTATTLSTSTSATGVSLSSTTTSMTISTTTTTAAAMATGMGSMGMSMSTVVGSAGRVCEIQVRALALPDHDTQPSVRAAQIRFNSSD